MNDQTLQTAPTPMDILRAVSPEGAKTYMDHRAATMDNPALQTVPLKYKPLIGPVPAAEGLVQQVPVLHVRGVHIRALRPPSGRQAGLHSVFGLRSITRCTSSHSSSC